MDNSRLIPHVLLLYEGMISATIFHTWYVPIFFEKRLIFGNDSFQVPIPIQYYIVVPNITFLLSILTPSRKQQALTLNHIICILLAHPGTTQRTTNFAHHCYLNMDLPMFVPFIFMPMLNFPCLLLRHFVYFSHDYFLFLSTQYHLFRIFLIYHYFVTVSFIT